MKFLTILLLLLLSPLVHALPDQLEVSGFIPGVTTKNEARVLMVRSGYFIIGGIELYCAPKFDDKSILKELYCYTGEDHDSRDSTKELRPLVTNLQVHEIFLRGLTKKLGKPLGSVDVPVTTRLGVTYKRNVVKWKDKIGNKLFLINRGEKVDSGLLYMTSAKQEQLEQQKKTQSEQQRKF